MKKKILFLIQNPNQGGLKNLVDRWKFALEKNDFIVNLKIIKKDSYTLHGYNLIHLFFSPLFSKKLFLKLFLKKIISRKKNVVLTYYNIKNDNKIKLLLRIILIKLTTNKLALPSQRMVNYYKKIGIKNSFLVHPIVPEDYSIYSKEDKRYISYFGALREDKGIDNLINISKFIQDKIYSAGFKIGNRKSEEYFNKINNNKKFVKVEKNYLNLLSKSKIVLFPYKDLSSTIDMPLALLESMKMGSVVLTSNISPLNLFLPKECLVDNWKDKKEVLDKIDYLKKNNKRISLKMIKIISKLDLDEKAFISNYKQLFEISKK